ELVERTESDAVDAKIALDNALLDHPPDLSLARVQIEELRRTKRRLDQNVAAYKEATAAAFEEFVDLAVLVISTAVTLGGGGAIPRAARATGATIGTKLVLKGDDYLGSDEFWNDLKGGVGAAAGGRLVEGALGPIANRIAGAAQRVGLSQKTAIAI